MNKIIITALFLLLIVVSCKQDTGVPKQIQPIDNLIPTKAKKVSHSHRAYTELSQSDIKDFAAIVFYHYYYSEYRSYLKPFIDYHLNRDGGYPLSEIPTIAGYLDKMSNARNCLLYAFYIDSKRYEDELFKIFNSLTLEAPVARRIAKYLCNKYYGKTSGDFIKQKTKKVEISN